MIVPIPPLPYLVVRLIGCRRPDARIQQNDTAIETNVFRANPSRDQKSEVLYVPIVGKQGLISFALVKEVEGEVIFENSKHDYAQRIAYQRVACD